jgi:hypothetical protein
VVEACDTLTLDPDVVVEEEVTLRAGQAVVIGSGFATAAGATVRFEIDPALLP